MLLMQQNLPGSPPLLYCKQQEARRGPGNKANILQVGDSPTENSYHFTGKSKAAGNIICVGEEKPADEPANKHVTSAKGKQCM